MRSTTILSVRRDGKVAIGGDGQVTMGDTIVKSDAKKIRTLAGGKVVTGFAGSTADALALLERFEVKLKEYPGNTLKAAIELAKEWRTDRSLRRLESLMIVVDAERTLLFGGAATSSSRRTALSASAAAGHTPSRRRGRCCANTDLSAEEIVREEPRDSRGDLRVHELSTSQWRSYRERRPHPETR